MKCTIIVTGEGAGAVKIQADGRNKRVILKYYPPFTDYISEMNNAQIDNVKDIDVVMLMHNLIECINSYSKTTGGLWQYCRDEQHATMTDFESLKFKGVITNLTGAKTFALIDTKVNVPVVTLSNQFNTEILQQLKSGFKHTIY